MSETMIVSWIIIILTESNNVLAAFVQDKLC